MIRSLYSAVGGLRAHQTKMDVIGNNIANVNTNGFKSSRVIFKDVYYQTIAGAAAPNAARMGTNPIQVGYGAQVGTIDVMNTRVGLAPTDRPLDIYIAGDGYITVQDGAGGKSFTRLGSFSFDVAGNLVDSNGYAVCGAEPTLIVPILNVSPINVAGINNYSNISISKDGKISGVNYTTGNIEVLAQIAIANFTNPDGLSQEGNMNLKDTANSGAPIYSVPGTDATGSFVSGALEMSNVDLTKEFTDMITTQRGFQANSRMITVSDEMLQEVVNLKR